VNVDAHTELEHMWFHARHYITYRPGLSFWLQEAS